MLKLSYYNEERYFIYNEKDKISEYLSAKKLLESSRGGKINIHSSQDKDFPYIRLYGPFNIQINA